MNRPKDKGGKDGSEEIGGQILHYLRRLTHAMDQHSSALAREYGLTAPQLAVLQILAQCGEASASELARRVSLSQPTVTGIVKRMLVKGLVTRRPSDWDRRVILLSPTSEGYAILAEAPPLLRQPFQDQLSRLEEEERLRLLDSLRRIVTMIEQPPFPPRRKPSSDRFQARDAAGAEPARQGWARVEPFLGEKPESS